MPVSVLPPRKLGRVRSVVDSLALLRSHPIFGALDSAQVERLGSYAHTRKIPGGTTLFVKGDPGTALFAVGAGTIKISVPSVDGREAIFNLLHAGEIFGEIALLDGRPRTADAIAMTDCELIVIERRDFLIFMNSEPNVAMKLIELLCARLRSAAQHFEEVVFLQWPVRLARMLLRLMEEAASSPNLRLLKITQREISQMLGTTRESVNKQLRTWEKRKWIALRRGGILVLNPEPLADLAAQTKAADDANADRPPARAPRA
jgi:CRP/FNR family transcriptional regulator, cyclic AMP receptor protein